MRVRQLLCDGRFRLLQNICDDLHKAFIDIEAELHGLKCLR